MEHRDIELIYQGTAQVESGDLEVGGKELKKYVDFIWQMTQNPADYSEPESSVLLPIDSNFKNFLMGKINGTKNSNLKYIVIIGIGGSNLGTMALYRALRGRLDVFIHTDEPKIIFIDTVSPPLVAQAVQLFNQSINSVDEVLINVISKSGETTETIANFEVIYDVAKKKFGESINKRIIITTDHGSKLWSMAEQRGLDLLEVPQKVGGRYSVLSAVGLFPLGLAGFDIEKFWDGAGEMVKRCTNGDVYQNPALLSALIIYSHYKKGIRIYNSFYFNPELKSLGKWYTQLIAESIGKEHNLDKEKVNAGITPIVSIGSTDLHPMAQLFFGGPRDKLTQFVYASQKEGSPVVPKEVFLPDLVTNIAGKDIAGIMNAIFYGVKIAYIKNNLPYSEIVMHEISENTLGQYLQLKMFEMMYLAKLIGVDAFDQPKVEDYKRETREILKKL